MSEDDEEYPEDSIGRIQRQAKLLEFEREITQENIRISRLPYAIKLRDYGDYLPEDSGMYPEDEDERE